MKDRHAVSEWREPA